MSRCSGDEYGYWPVYVSKITMPNENLSHPQQPNHPHNHTTTQPHNHNHIHNHTTTSAINQHRINIESNAIHNHDNVHVGLLAVLVVAQHFRTHVHWSSDACHRLCLLWLDRRDSKVGNLARPLAVYQQILWLQVSMNQFARVQVAPCRIVVLS